MSVSSVLEVRFWKGSPVLSSVSMQVLFVLRLIAGVAALADEAAAVGADAIGVARAFLGLGRFGETRERDTDDHEQDDR